MYIMLESDSISVMKCENKMSFDTKEEAQTTATVASHQRGSKLTAYRCSKCSLWHLSSLS